MSELLSPEILIIMNTQGGGNDMGGVASARPCPAPPGVNQPGRTTMSAAKRPPRPPANVPPLGTVRPCARGWVVQHLYIHAHLVCS